jgi:hypothetical protein
MDDRGRFGAGPVVDLMILDELKRKEEEEKKKRKLSPPTLIVSETLPLSFAPPSVR